jgi:hypothetical protein
MDLWVVYNEDLKTHVVSTATPNLPANVAVVPVTIPSGLPAKVALETALSAISNVANLGGNAQYVAARISFS